MAKSPSTDNYVLGKGVVYFDELISGVYQGERDLGNAPAFSFSVAVEKLEHYSSRGGLRAKDKEVISQITPSLAFTLDEINADNIALLSLGNVLDVTQTPAATYATTPEDVVASELGNRVSLGLRRVGTYTLQHVVGPTFLVDFTITGDTSGATMYVVEVVDTTHVRGYMTNGLSFIPGEGITDDQGAPETGTLTASGAVTWNAGPELVTDVGAATTFVEGTDYEVNTLLKDDQIGRIKLLEGGGITPGETLEITYYENYIAYKQVQTFTKTSIEGFLRFISDNPVGTQQELKVWRCSLTPTGDTAMIGDDWSTLGFTGEILKDETMVDSPYMDINFL